MSITTRRLLGGLLLLPVLLCVVADSGAAQVNVAGQVNTRAIRPAEQAFLDRMAAEFAKILPPVPAGWVEVERRIYDSGGTTSDWSAPLSADYAWLIVSSDLEARQKVVDQRLQEASEKNQGAFDAATARNQKLMEEFSAKLQAAIAKQDQALVDRLQADFKKKMDEGAKATTPSTARAPELSDTDARISISINPYNASVMAEKQLPTPTGFSWAGRREPDENSSDREGVTRYLIGNWAPDSDGSGRTLKFTPNKATVVYGIAIEIQARADRAEALFRAMSIVRLKALLQQ